MLILSDKYFADYQEHLTVDVDITLKEIDKVNLGERSFTFYTSVAVISSSKTEGEQIEVDSYVKHKMQHIDYLPELVNKPNDLYQAYVFAKQNDLSAANFLQSHSLLSQHLLPGHRRGVYRKNQILVMEHQTGKI